MISRTDGRTTVVAAQIAGSYLDGVASAERAAQALAQAADLGAWLVVFPESFLPGQPAFTDVALPSSPGFKRSWELFQAAAVAIDGPEVRIVADACAAHQVYAALGITERVARSGTLYSTLVYLAPDGTVAGVHRKLVPTDTERLVWGMGDGTSLRALDTPHGVLGGLICWENHMPLARMALYLEGVQIHVAPTLVPGTEMWLTALRAMAYEGRMWVVSVGGLLRRSDLPAEIRELDIFPEEVINPGGSCIIDPSGRVVAGPAHAEEVLLHVEADPLVALRRKRTFDVAGHYSRPDVFTLHVDGRPRRGPS